VARRSSKGYQGKKGHWHCQCSDSPGNNSLGPPTESLSLKVSGQFEYLHGQGTHCICPRPNLPFAHCMLHVGSTEQTTERATPQPEVCTQLQIAAISSFLRQHASCRNECAAYYLPSASVSQGVESQMASWNRDCAAVVVRRHVRRVSQRHWP